MTTSTTHTTVTDHRGLLRVFASMAGRRFIGVVDGGDNCIEPVFDNPRNTNGNLITIYTGGVHKGAVFHGYVCQDFIDSGYGGGDVE